MNRNKEKGREGERKKRNKEEKRQKGKIQTHPCVFIRKENSETPSKAVYGQLHDKEHAISYIIK